MKLHARLISLFTHSRSFPAVELSSFAPAATSVVGVRHLRSTSAGGPGHAPKDTESDMMDEVEIAAETNTDADVDTPPRGADIKAQMGENVQYDKRENLPPGWRKIEDKEGEGERAVDPVGRPGGADA